MIGHIIPETNRAWQLLMDLKDIVELVVSPKFSEDSLCYLKTKISDHDSLFIDVFPNEKLKSKHHFLEHYPSLIQCALRQSRVSSNGLSITCTISKTYCRHCLPSTNLWLHMYCSLPAFSNNPFMLTE